MDNTAVTHGLTNVHAPAHTKAKLLEMALAHELLRDVDVALVRFVERQCQRSLPPLVALALAYTSNQAGMGHVCLDVSLFFDDGRQVFAKRGRLYRQRHLQDPSGGMSNGLDHEQESLLETLLGQAWQDQDFATWLEVLTECPAVDEQSLFEPPRDALHDSFQNAPLDLSAMGATTALSAPFVLDTSGNRPLLYLRRYWQCEHLIVNFVRSRCQTAINEARIDAIATVVSRFFAQPQSGDDLDWQRIAVAIASLQDFAIITGGPGTGKTTTVLKLLCVLQAAQLQQGLAPLRIRLAAPTGKAAARLNESIARSINRLNIATNDRYDADQLRASIPSSVTTLHKLLGALPHSRHFRHGINNPLACDLVVVDEASMIDIEMMAALVQALGARTRLLLIGDKDQLASVEAGAIFGDLCQPATAGHYTPATVAQVQRLSGDTIPSEYQNDTGHGLSQATCMLRKSYRFAQGGGIAALAALVNGSNSPSGEDMVRQAHGIFDQEQMRATQAGQKSALQLLTYADDFDADFWQNVSKHLAPYLAKAQQPIGDSIAEQDAWAQAVLACHGQFQLLVAVRQGLQGLHAMNQAIEDILQGQGLIEKTQSSWYVGRPVMITRNDYHTKLMNGDLGICLHYQNPDTGARSLRVAFADGHGGVRWILPSKLRQLDTALAMTVHKSQGSEFDHTMLVLPKQPSKVIGKELLYTGITRAKQCFTLVYHNDYSLREAMTRRTQRVSGLAKLFGESE